MRGLETVLGNPFSQRLGWALLAFLWQGTLVATLLACAGVALRGKKAAVRYAVGCGAMALMLAMPVTTFLRHRPEAGNAWSASAAQVAAAPESSRPGRGLSQAAPLSVSGHSSGGSLASTIRRGAGPLARFLVAGWILGVFLLSLRFLGGWTAVRRLVRRDVSPVPEALQKTVARLCRRLRVSRPVALAQSAALAVPAALGAVRPVILLPSAPSRVCRGTRSRPFSPTSSRTSAGTITWSTFFRPPSRRSSSTTRPSGGSRTASVSSGRTAATTWPSWPRATRAPTPARSSGSRKSAGWRPSWLSRPTADLSGGGWRGYCPSQPLPPTAPRVGSRACWRSRCSARSGRQRGSAAGQSGSRVSGTRVAGGVGGGITGGVASGVAGGVTGGVGGGDSGGITGGVASDAVEEPSGDAGKNTPLSPGDLASLRTHGVTPEFLREIAALGYKTASVSDLVALRIHGVTPDYIARMTALVGKQSLEELISLRIHGVTPEFEERFHAVGYPRISADSFLSLRIHGVDPDTAGEWEKIGFRKPALDEIVSAGGIHDEASENANPVSPRPRDPDLRRSRRAGPLARAVAGRTVDPRLRP